MESGKLAAKHLIDWAKCFPFYGQEQVPRKLFLEAFEKFVKEVDEMENRLSTLEKK